MSIALSFMIPIFSGILSVRAVKRFMSDKISQWSFEYQVLGFGGALVFVFGLIYAFENLAYSLAG